VKIALVGSEPESHGFAPWDDPSWEIWSCGLSSENFPRVDRHFEVHCLALVEQSFGPDRVEKWVAHLNSHPCVISLRRQPELPNAELLDIPALFRRFGPYFFDSTMSWMMGKAIMDAEKRRDSHEEIGLWGIDCSAKEEYLLQRKGVQFFINEAYRSGISIYAPPESDILAPAPQYGLREFDNQFRKTQARKRRLEAERTALQIEAARNADKLAELNAMCEYLEYSQRTWSGIHVEKRRGGADKEGPRLSAIGGR
jgi:hypothetical protein